jgi:hypothetical protein
MAFTSQAFTHVTLLDSIQQALELVVAPVASKYQVHQWVADDMPRYIGNDIGVTFRTTVQTPVQFTGANRRGFLANQNLEVVVYTRYASDAAFSNRQLTTNQGNGFYRVLYRVADCFQGLNIFSAYNGDWQPNEYGATSIPEGAVPLTIRPCQMTSFTVPYKTKADAGWVAGRITFDLLLVQPLTL